jgi:carbamoyltransferase
MAMSNGSPTVMGVYLGHDLGVCLLRNGEIVTMIEEERLNRFKHGRSNDVAGLWGLFAGKFGYFPWASVCYCLQAANLSIDDLDAIVLGDAMWAGAAENTIRSMIPIKDKSKVIFVSEPEGGVHHFHHGLSGFMASPFEEAAVLVVDADGNSTKDGYEAETGFHFENREGKYRQVFKNRYKDVAVPRSGIGWTYEQVTLLLGFSSTKVFISDAGKTMGLASYGRSRPEFEKPWFSYDEFKLDFTGFKEWLRESGNESRVLSYKDGLATHPNGITQYAMDLAFKVQSELEVAMLHLATEMHRATGSKNLCLAGGVALNSIANTIVTSRGPFENVFIQPAANDGGQAIGLAYHGHLLLTRNGHGNGHSSSKSQARVNSNGVIHPIKHNYGGRVYQRDEIEEVLLRSGLTFRELPNDDVVAEEASQELVDHRILGWFQGGCEYGPRALGHRSILANPDLEETKDLLNRRVKFREPFRPFAPSVLTERASEIFEMSGASPYMLLVVPVRESWKKRVPAITHVDGTARVQTVDAEVEPLFYKLISAFDHKTGIPLVLNTSFNLRGMPIVESPYDALQCFLYTDMDSLYLGRFKIGRADPALLFPTKSLGWEFAVESSIDSGKQALICKHADMGKQIKVDATPEFLSVCEALDGVRSLQGAYDKAYGDSAAVSVQKVFVQIQSLVRQGVMQLRVGNLTFKHPETKLHFWQAAVQAASNKR